MTVQIQEHYSGAEQQLTDSLEALPRGYFLAHRTGDTKFYFSPSAHIMGNVLRVSPSTARRRLLATQNYHKKPHPYNALFPWPSDMMEAEDPYRMLREAVKKEEGFYTLLDHEPDEAIQGLELRGDVLTARVRSKSGHGIYNTQLRNAYLDEDGRFRLVDMKCECEDHFWAAAKGGSVRSLLECLHIAAMEQDVYERLNYGDMGKAPMKIVGRLDRSMFSPFRFVQNLERGKNGKIRFISNATAALEWYVIVDHYVNGSSFYDINQRLFMLQNLYSNELYTSILRGETTFEILKQRAKRKANKARINAEKSLFIQLNRHLKSHGYHSDGFYLELGQPAMRYESAKATVGIVFNDEFPPFWVVRRKNIVHGFPNPTQRDHGPANPFEQLDYRQQRLDDRTKTITEARVGISHLLWIPEFEKPLTLRVPEILKAEYRRHKEQAKSS